MIVCDLDGRGGGGRPVAVQRHRRPCVRLPGDAARRRRRAHPLHLRLRLGGAGRADPVRAHGDGRRVRRRDPGRPVRADRQRRHRQGHRRDAVGTPLAGGADAEPRGFHHRQGPEGGGQGGGDVRGRRPHRAHLPPAGRAAAHRAERHRLSVRPLPERLRPAADQRPSHGRLTKGEHVPNGSPYEDVEIWFLTGSQSLYGDETLQQVAEQSREIAETLGAASCRRGSSGSPVLTDRRRDPAGLPGGHRLRRLRGRDRLDAHVLAGQDVDRWTGRAAQAVAAPAHPGQRVAALVRRSTWTS